MLFELGVQVRRQQMIVESDGRRTDVAQCPEVDVVDAQFVAQPHEVRHLVNVIPVDYKGNVYAIRPIDGSDGAVSFRDQILDRADCVVKRVSAQTHYSIVRPRRSSVQADVVSLDVQTFQRLFSLLEKYAVCDYVGLAARVEICSQLFK